MNESLFMELTAQLTADLDVGGIPRSAWFWEETLGEADSCFRHAEVSGDEHLVLRDSKTDGASHMLNAALEPFRTAPTYLPPTGEDGSGPLVGLRTDAAVSIVPFTILGSDGGQVEYALRGVIGVTRGGQRWVRAAGEAGVLLVNLCDDDFGELPSSVRKALQVTAVTQEVYMEAVAPPATWTPLESLTGRAVQAAGGKLADLLDEHEPRSAGDFHAYALMAQHAMRHTAVLGFLHFSGAAEGFPVDELIRLRTHGSIAFDDYEHGPETNSRILSPAATAVLRRAAAHLGQLRWEDLDVETLGSLQGWGPEESRWWGMPGLAALSNELAPQSEHAWSSLRSLMQGSEIDIVLDADRIGLHVPD